VRGNHYICQSDVHDTGYQPTREETQRGYASFPDIPTERLDSILEKYWARYGALLNIAVFPHVPKDEKLERISIDFGNEAPGTELPNPYQKQEASFLGSGRTHNPVVDNYPQGGDGRGEFLVTDGMTVTLPSTTRVAAKVTHLGRGAVTMKAFSNGQIVGSAAEATDASSVHLLTTEGADIDRVPRRDHRRIRR